MELLLKTMVWLLTTPLEKYGNKNVIQCAVDHAAKRLLIAKFHYTGPTGPSQRTLSGRVGSGRARLVEFSYKRFKNIRYRIILMLFGRD